MDFGYVSSGSLHIWFDAWIFRSANQMALVMGFWYWWIMCAEYTLDWLQFKVLRVIVFVQHSIANWCLSTGWSRKKLHKFCRAITFEPFVLGLQCRINSSYKIIQSMPFPLSHRKLSNHSVNRPTFFNSHSFN